MTYRPLTAIAAASAFAVMASACAGSPSADEAQSGEITSCGHTVAIDEPPERVVVQPHNLTEVLAALGLADRIVGYSNFGQFTPAEQFADDLEGIPELGNGRLSREVVVDQEPDLLYSNINYDESMTDEYGPLDIPVLFVTMYCPEHAPTDDDGQPMLIESLYQDFEDLGRIFDIEDTAAELIDDLRTRVTAVSETVEDEPEVRVAPIFFFSGIDGALSAHGGITFIGELIEAAGGVNVYESIEGQGEVSIETLIDHEPDVIVIQLTGETDFDQTREFLLNDPRFADIPAVQNDRITFIPNEEAWPSVRFPDAIARFAEVFHQADRAHRSETEYR